MKYLVTGVCKVNDKIISVHEIVSATSSLSAETRALNMAINSVQALVKSGYWVYEPNVTEEKPNAGN